LDEGSVEFAFLLLLDLDVLAEPGETFEDALWKNVSMRILNSGLFIVWCMRCLPSPLVAQLGSTFQTWSLAILSRSRAWATSLGRMAEKKVISIYNLASVGYELKHTAIDILLVGEDEENDVAHFAVLDDTAEFGLGFFHASSVAGVDYENESVGACWVGLVSLWFGVADFDWLLKAI
jgi:hypothetical protein